MSATATDTRDELVAEVYGLGQQVELLRAEVADVAEQLAEVLDFARSADAAVKRVGPMLDGLSSNPMLRGLLGGR